MENESSGVVRRSSKWELLGMIKSYASSRGDYGLCSWVDIQLGVDLDFFVREVSDDERQLFYGKFGPLRKSHHLLTEAPQKFIEFVCGAYTDAVKYAEFTGIKIEADSAPVSSGGTSKTYCFKAEFLEMLGLRGQVYGTKLSFKYPHPHENGEHNIEDYVSGQLVDLRESLLGKLKDAEIVVENKTLHISKKQEGTA